MFGGLWGSALRESCFRGLCFLYSATVVVKCKVTLLAKVLKILGSDGTCFCGAALHYILFVSLPL